MAIARRFATEGARLVLVDISEKRLPSAIKELPPATEVLWKSPVNVLENDHVKGIVDEAIDRFGRIDILVNIVGGIASRQITTPMLEMDDAQLTATFALNVKSIFVTSRHILPHMKRNRYGRVVNITSTSMAGEAGQSDYSAAKAGVAGLTRTMAIEFAPDITVNCIAPSLIRTRVMEAFDPEIIKTYAERPLLRRIGEPDDIANAALFLGSDEAAYITGIMLPVTGGAWPAL
jgi:NAD(P)-dependent dehydrogenase (short-subunit alcohol dehydrogenase family)